MKNRAKRPTGVLIALVMGGAMTSCERVTGVFSDVEGTRGKVASVTAQLEQAKKDLDETTMASRDVQTKNVEHALGRASLERIDKEIAEVGAKETAAKLALEGLDADLQAYLQQRAKH